MGAQKNMGSHRGMLRPNAVTMNLLLPFLLITSSIFILNFKTNN